MYLVFLWSFLFLFLLFFGRGGEAVLKKKKRKEKKTLFFVRFSISKFYHYSYSMGHYLKLVNLEGGRPHYSSRAASRLNMNFN